MNVIDLRKNAINDYHEYVESFLNSLNKGDMYILIYK